MKNLGLVNILALISCVLLSSCAQPENVEWVVKVNNEPITTAELQTGLINLSDLQKQVPQQQQTQTALNQLIQSEIFYQEALKNNLDQNEDYQNFIKQLDNQYAYQKQQGLVELFIRENVNSKIQITENDALAVYEKNKDALFTEYEQRAVSHIVVKTEDEANTIYKQLQKGSNFGSLAKTKSIDVQTGQNGGKISGYFRKEGLTKEFANSIFNLSKVGRYTKPVLSEAGYHIFKLDDKRLIPARDFSEVKDAITNQIYVAKRNEELNNILSNIKDNYEITENEELIKKDTDDVANATPETDSK